MRGAFAFILPAALALILLGCTGGSTGSAPGNTPPPQNTSPTTAPAGAAANNNQDQIVITGAINKKYTPTDPSAVRIVDSVGIGLDEQFPCGVLVQFPANTQPGTYPIEDMRQPVPKKIFGRYGELCELPEGFYESTDGQLVLTVSGTSFSGTFEFNAASVKDKTKTIRVVGSFKDVSLP